MTYITILTHDDRWIECWLPARFAGDVEKVLAILSENGLMKESVA